MTTIKDIAKVSGYSVSTVSYALARNPKIPIETQDKILKVAEELNYTPNALAVGLKKKESKNIGIFLPGFQGPIHSTIVAGIAESMARHGNEYKLIVSLSVTGYQFIYEGLTDIVFTMSPVINDEEIIKISKICPLVLFDKIFLGKNIYNTYFENAEGIYKRVKDFYEKGARSFSFVSGSQVSNHNKDRLKGFMMAINELNIEDYDVIEAFGYTEELGYNAIKNYLIHNSVKDALICSNDELAIGAMTALNEAGISIPEQVKISGFDNISKGEFTTPSLSTITVDWFDYGLRIGDYLLDILKKKNVNSIIRLTTSLVNRHSG